MPATSIKEYRDSLRDEELIQYSIGCLVGERIKAQIGQTNLSDAAVIYCCRYIGAMGIALEVQPYATEEERERIIKDTFSFMELHFAETHAQLVKTFEEKHGAGVAGHG